MDPFVIMIWVELTMILILAAFMGIMVSRFLTQVAAWLNIVGAKIEKLEKKLNNVPFMGGGSSDQDGNASQAPNPLSMIGQLFGMFGGK